MSTKFHSRSTAELMVLDASGLYKVKLDDFDAF